MQKGITIIETLLVLAVISLLVASATVFYYSFLADYQLGTDTTEILGVLRLAQSKAMAEEGGLKFGVHFSSHQYILFAGDSYALRNADYDEIYDTSSAVTLSWAFGGTNDVIFEKLIGTPNNAGTVTLTNVDNKFNTTSVNAAGKIELQ